MSLGVGRIAGPDQAAIFVEIGDLAANLALAFGEDQRVAIRHSLQNAGLFALGFVSAGRYSSIGCHSYRWSGVVGT